MLVATLLFLSPVLVAAEVITLQFETQSTQGSGVYRLDFFDTEGTLHHGGEWCCFQPATVRELRVPGESHKMTALHIISLNITTLWDISSVKVDNDPWKLQNGSSNALIGQNIASTVIFYNPKHTQTTSKPWRLWAVMGSAGLFLACCATSIIFYRHSVKENGRKAPADSTEPEQNVKKIATEVEEEEEEEEEVADPLGLSVNTVESMGTCSIATQEVAVHPNAPDTYSSIPDRGLRRSSSQSLLVFDRPVTSCSRSVKRTSSLRSLHRKVSSLTPPYTRSPPISDILVGGGAGVDGLKGILSNSPSALALPVLSCPPRPYTQGCHFEVEANWV
eukprot:TRINITY_DN3632_c1_g1_i1.p1 TRINITY_DN3632_c1_g1~~TRINITY_DN3632_c1_g1_i1.p1  ORF type:complete len:346 (+),score=28.04 TRINITY_DN3632_c1_g1_i1:38-1039(+)